MKTGLAPLIVLAVTGAARAEDTLPAGPGKNEVATICSRCHSLDQVVSEHRTSDQWTATVTRMISNGAPIADDQFDLIVGYLAANFGPGNAKSAAGKDADDKH